jgi:Zn-dependent protease with chaperone function
MTGIDFDFARYIAYRRGVVELRARDGAAYAYRGERKIRRALDTARPVSMAIEATTRMWKKAARNELLGTSIKVSEQQFPRAHQAAIAASRALRLAAPPVYVTPSSSRIQAQVLGTNDDAYLLLNAGVVDRLTDSELTATVGGQLAHVQNNHVIYSTALFYLTHDAMVFVRWIVQPAILALQAWSRRAEITCDRAALLCARDLNVTVGALVKLSIGTDQKIDIVEYLEQLPGTRSGVGKYAELFRSHPYLPKRVAALRKFAESSFYRKFVGAPADGALSTEDLDGQVATLLKVF